MVAHKDITDPNIHEVKGAATATAGQVLIANGSGSASFQNPPYSLAEVGWYDYNDTATTTTPIAITLANTFYDLTNNKLGAQTTNAYGVSDTVDLWNSATNRFDFSNLPLGSVVTTRVDLNWTTASANNSLEVDFEFAIGSGASFYLPVLGPAYVKAAANNRFVVERSFYIGNNNIKNYPARLCAKNDTTGSTIIVNGFYSVVSKNG
jgi:hypothetical protein